MKTTPELFQKALSVKLNGKAYWNYVHELRRRGSKETFAIAKDLCLSHRKHNRVLGIDILCQLRTYANDPDQSKITSSRPFRPKDSIHLIRPMLNDNRKEVFLSAIYALGHLHDPERSKLIVPFARHRSADVRYAVTFALGGDSRPLAINALILLMEDKDPQVRDWATFGLAELANIKRTNTSKIKEALFKRLYDTHIGPRGEAMIGLAKRKDERVVECIKRELSCKRPRVYALLAAEEFASSILLPELENLWKSCESGDDSYWVGQLKSALAACKPKTEESA